ncbi:hypothetical protein PR048_001421 [Dryococelus australis]|uniref:DUF7869 domain-containing protein n=1 Tax=Dryococelus australis TaxID=614101 RepID=A0ABQ9IIP2_9NEOP|nr:hypothetical protein PR048_001421 [Dryococelus australis]
MPRPAQSENSETHESFGAICRDFLNMIVRCFQEYWNLGYRDRRASVVSSLISLYRKKTYKEYDGNKEKNREFSCKFEVVIDNVRHPTGKECSIRIFGDTKGFVDCLVQKRGHLLVLFHLMVVAKHFLQVKRQINNGARQHILSFPNYGSRGGNEIASWLYQHILDLPDDTETITFYLDTCSGQNKNSYTAFMFCYAMKSSRHLLAINHKFLVSGHTHMKCNSDHSVIERQKKKTLMKINHPNDWVQLIRSCKHRNPFKVFIMERKHFFNFGSLGQAQGPFLLKKVNEDGDEFLWQPVQWLQYTTNFGLIQYKTAIKDEEPFSALNIRRCGKHTLPAQLPLLHIGSLAISKGKNKDDLDLLPLIDLFFITSTTT